MRLLLTADLRYRLSWFKWLEAQAVQYDAIAISGDLLDVFQKEPLRRQIYRTTNWLRTLASKSSVGVCSGNHDTIDIPTERLLCPTPAWLAKLDPVLTIDGKTAPGLRIWDIAFVIYRYAPLCDLRERALTRAFLRQIAKRIRTLSSAYGFFENHDLFDWIRLRLKTEIRLFEDGENEDTARRRKLIEEGHLALYRRDLRLIAGVSPVLRGLI
jgi:hypothetical protein